MQFSYATIVAASLAMSSSLVAAAPAKSTNLVPRYYNHGWCVLHLRQYQKNESASKGGSPHHNTGPEYEYTVQVTDGKALDMNPGVVCPYTSLGDGQEWSFVSQLPYPLVIHGGATDFDPIGFSYNGVTWTSKDNANHYCVEGAFADGSRGIDCGWTC